MASQVSHFLCAIALCTTLGTIAPTATHAQSSQFDVAANDLLNDFEACLSAPEQAMDDDMHAYCNALASELTQLYAAGRVTSPPSTLPSPRPILDKLPFGLGRYIGAWFD